MKTLNRVFLMGYLGEAPELQISKSGKPYSRLKVATHRSWMNAEEQWETKTDWHSVFVWGPLAERCCHNLQKGALVFVEGSLTYWQVAMNQSHDYKNAIQGHEVKFLQASGKGREIPPAAAEAPFDGQTAEPVAQDLDNDEAARNHNAVAHPA